MSSDSSPSPALRIGMLTGIVVVLFLALVSRLWFLQVLAGERYDQLSERNQLQVVYTEAPRGRILASDGTPIVSNRPALTVSADRKQLLDDAGQPQDAEARAVLDRLSRLLDMPVSEIVTQLTDRKYSPFKPVPIAIDVSPEVVMAVQEHQELFPGVTAERLPVRAYPQGDVASHLLGYTAEISESQLQQEQFSDYHLGAIVGQEGLEKSYEQQLQGERGRRLLVVNAHGTVLRERSERQPVPGNDLVTSIDLELQKKTERLLAEQIKRTRGTTDGQGRTLNPPGGAAVAVDVDTGEILAMASYPGYDPRKFVGGVSTEYFNDVYRDVIVSPDGGDDGNEPQVRDDPDPEPKAGLNRAISDAWAPGSVFKAITAAGFLRTGILEPSTSLPCPPVWDLGPRSFRNWNSTHEGMMDVTTALMRSCDTFFYEAASRELAREAQDDGEGGDPTGMQNMARAFGYDDPLGVDLPDEVGGVIPDKSWKQAYWEQMRDYWCGLQNDPGQSRFQQEILRENCESFNHWNGGDSVNMSIGQGFVTATPLQVASSFAAVANGGKLMWPHVGVAIRSPEGDTVETIEPRVLNDVPLSETNLQAIQTGLEQVVMSSSGTAGGAFAGFPLDRIPVAGKTGSAEWSADEPTHAWFAAYAPADDPEIAVMATVEKGGGGSSTAAPIVRRILEAHFGLEITPW